jgi:uroporphyrinogen decarboxylase
MKQSFVIPSVEEEKLTSRERVITALKLKQPDRVPWVESSVHNRLAEKLLQRSNFEKATVTQRFAVPGTRIPPEVLEVIALDNLTFSIAPPRFVKSQSFAGMEMSARFRGSDRALAVTTRMGISNTYLSMGMEHFSLMLFDNPKFVWHLMDIFVDWACKAVTKINDLGFDFMIVPEDLAWKQGPLFSPKTVRELFLPRMKKVAEKIKLPWIYHSDGNLLPIFDDLLTLGMNGLANVEPNAMDIVELKKKYGRLICLMGNIDLHYTLTRGTPEETEAEVKKRIQELGPGGGYILASSNGLTAYCQPENVLAMSRALLKYGYY